MDVYVKRTEPSSVQDTITVIEKGWILIVDDNKEYAEGRPLFRILEMGIKKIFGNMVHVTSHVTPRGWETIMQGNVLPEVVVHDKNLDDFVDCPFDSIDSILTFVKKGTRIIMHSASDEQTLKNEFKAIQDSVYFTTPYAQQQGMEYAQKDRNLLEHVQFARKGSYIDICSILRNIL